MKTSIIIPCYNAVKYLPETLRSVFAQTVSDWELILIDDGSTDGTAEIISQFAKQDTRVRTVEQTNQGVSAARNAGFAKSSPDTEYVTFLDSDDLWEPDALERLQAALSADPSAVAANGLHRIIDGNGAFIAETSSVSYELDRFGIKGGSLVPWPDEAPTSFATLVYKNYIMTPGTLLIRRSELEKIELFQPGLTHAEDWDVWLRLSLLGDIPVVRKDVLRYLRHGEGASASKRRIYQGERTVREKLLASPELSEEQRKMVRLGARFAERDRSRDMLGWAKDNIRQGNLPAAARQLRHSALGYMRYLRG